MIENIHINEIADALSKHHAALMVGAGFSKNAQKSAVSDKKFLDWNQLSDLFYTSVYGENGPGKEYYSSLRLAQEVEIMSGRTKIDQLLKEAVPDMDYSPSQLHIQMMELPWVDVFTTNYDTLLERAADSVTSHRYNTVVTQEDLINSNDVARIIKLHGSFPSHRPFIITEEDYRTYPAKFAAFVNTVQQALLENIFCMIGFSCEDPNFLKWIGWIHDNLGKSSLQKIYMVSVSSVPEAKSRLLFEQNIIVIDLKSLWPDKSIEQRIALFLNELRDKVRKKEESSNWFNANTLPNGWYKNLTDETKLLHKLNGDYPGWIVLPWKMKSRADFIIDKVALEKILGEGAIVEQIEFIYEYTRFCDIAGRPLPPEKTEKFWKIMSGINTLSSNKNYAHLQSIYLQLLRAFREQANWELYDACHEKIDIDALDYEGKQFLCASDWWKSLYKFEIEELPDKLDNWILSKEDLYWPLIKSSMYAMVGEPIKAERLLLDNLVSIRKYLVRSEKKQYLSSLEESCVSLFNFIKQRNFTFDGMESSIHKGDFSWWNENDKYCLYLELPKKHKPPFELRIEFDLRITQTTNMGLDNTYIFHSLEYLRFIEQSGHPLRLANVTNTKAIDGLFNNLAPYYSNWCLVQMLLAQDTKHIDLFFGRAQLANMTQDDVDTIAKNYVDILKKLADKVDEKNWFTPVSLYDQAAKVLPQLLARLSYKCSVDLLDLILEATLEICQSNVRRNFAGLTKLLKGVVESYAPEEQMVRLDKILMFPIETARQNEYLDPINYISVPERKVKLSSDIYERTIYEIRRVMSQNDAEQRKYASNRLIILFQAVELLDEDKKFLLKTLEDEKSDLLCFLDDADKKISAKNILEETLNTLERHVKEAGITYGTSPFENVFRLLNDIDAESVEYLRAFRIIKNYAEKYYHLTINRSNYDFNHEIQNSFLLLVNLVILKPDFSSEEMVAISEVLEIFKNYYRPYVISLFERDCVHHDIDKEDGISDIELWLSEEKDIKMLGSYYMLLRNSRRDVTTFEETYSFWNNVFRFSIYRVLSSETMQLDALRLCHSLLLFKYPKEDELELLFVALDQLIGITTIIDDDEEQEAINKILCRIWSCRIAAELYKQGSRTEMVLRWKEISENRDESMEIRNIEFVEGSEAISLS